MTKGVLILKSLIIKRRLREICNTMDISYKYCHAVASELKDPSLDLMRKLRFLIPLDFWVDEASTEFYQQLQKNMNSWHNSIIVVYYNYRGNLCSK